MSGRLCRPTCLNGGTCQVTENICVCTSMFYGDRCERDVAMTVTFVLIAIATLLAIAACLLVAYCQRYREEQDRPLIINRIISVRAKRRTTKIDRSKNDLPPAYDDVSVAEGQVETDVNEIEDAISSERTADDTAANHFNDGESEIEVSRTGQIEELSVSHVREEAVKTTESGNNEVSGAATSENRTDADKQNRRSDELDKSEPPPDYTEVHENRASKRILQEHAESEEANANDTESDI
ncbi:uncharacterized protein [Antedon mediterranea]|uniref:uncharacterized protein isoform X2 n=1 Tax=Antedon mediterranea TaxID=105859 RepID=UPI003AF53A08